LNGTKSNMVLVKPSMTKKKVPPDQAPIEPTRVVPYPQKAKEKKKKSAIKHQTKLSANQVKKKAKG